MSHKKRNLKIARNVILVSILMAISFHIGQLRVYYLVMQEVDKIEHAFTDFYVIRKNVKST